MFEPQRSSFARQLEPIQVSAHVREVAQWVVMLLGWVWLGEQGMRMGWTLASGVLPVALWWATRLLMRGNHWALRSTTAAMGLLGALSAVSVLLPGILASLKGLPVGLAHASLLAVAVLWGAWSGLVETSSRGISLQTGTLPWHPVLAAALVWVTWRVPGGALPATAAVSLLMTACAVVLCTHDRARVGLLPVCRAPRAGLAGVLAPSGMGLMMGGLWLSNVWCAGLGWTVETMVAWHVAMMAALPMLVAMIGRWVRAHLAPHPAWFDARAQSCLSLSMLALGASMLLGQTAWHGLLAMFLPSVAWALHCIRPRAAMHNPERALHWLSRCLALALGPALLLWVGLATPMHGPGAMQSALALLGTFAAAQVLLLWRRQPVARPTWFTT